MACPILTLPDFSLTVYKNYCHLLRTRKHTVISVMLSLTTVASAVYAQDNTVAAPASPNGSYTVNDPLLSTTPPEERGWKALAQALELLAPSVDTSLPLSGTQVAERIAQLIAQDRNEQALQAINNRLQERTQQNEPGSDVQMQFLRARALSGLQRHNEAIKIYQELTSYYPELPEPWNNLAAEYILQDKLDMALDALKMALMADPAYTLARTNMGETQLMLAQRSFDLASQSGSSRARTRAQQTLKILQQ